MKTVYPPQTKFAGGINRIFSEMKNLQCIQNDIVVNFDDFIRIAHCALNIESTQPVAILTFEWTYK